MLTDGDATRKSHVRSAPTPPLTIPSQRATTTASDHSRMSSSLATRAHTVDADRHRDGVRDQKDPTIAIEYATSPLSRSTSKAASCSSSARLPCQRSPSCAAGAGLRTGGFCFRPPSSRAAVEPSERGPVGRASGGVRRLSSRARRGDALRPRSVAAGSPGRLCRRRAGPALSRSRRAAGGARGVAVWLSRNFWAGEGVVWVSDPRFGPGGLGTVGRCETAIFE